MRRVTDELLRSKAAGRKEPLLLRGVFTPTEPPFRLKFRSRSHGVREGSIRSFTLHPGASAFGLICLVASGFFALFPQLSGISSLGLTQTASFVYAISGGLLLCAMPFMIIVLRSSRIQPRVQINDLQKTVQIGSGIVYQMQAKGEHSVVLRLHDTTLAGRPPRQMTSVVLYTPTDIAVLACVENRQQAIAYIEKSRLKDCNVATGHPILARTKYMF